MHFRGQTCCVCTILLCFQLCHRHSVSFRHVSWTQIEDHPCSSTHPISTHPIFPEPHAKRLLPSLCGTCKRCLVAKELSFSKKRPTGTFSRFHASCVGLFKFLVLDAQDLVHAQSQVPLCVVDVVDRLDQHTRGALSQAPVACSEATETSLRAGT